MESKIVFLVLVLVGSSTFAAEIRGRERLDPVKQTADKSLQKEGPGDLEVNDTEGNGSPLRPLNSASTTTIPDTPTPAILQQLEDQLYVSLKNADDVLSFLEHGTFQDANTSESAEEKTHTNTTAGNHTSSEHGKHISHIFGVFKNFLDAFSRPGSDTSEETVSPTPASTVNDTTVQDETDEYERSIEVKNTAEDKSLLENQLDKGQEKAGKDIVQNTTADHPVVDGTSGDEVSACYHKVDTGLCRAYIPRWYFNPDDRTCKKFVYGGCQGNNNNFEDDYTCYATCRGEIPCKTDPAKVCRLSESPCKNTTCAGHEDALCRMRPCTCEVYFVDTEGQEVGCSIKVDQSDLPKAGNIDSHENILCPENPEKVCHMAGSACDHLTCPEHPEAKCTVLPCSCEAVFKDKAGLLVNCSGSIQESPKSSGTDTLNKDSTLDDTKKPGPCRKVAIGLTVTALLLLLLLAFGVGCYRKHRAVGSYSLFSNLSGSIASLMERQKENLAEYTAKKSAEDSMVCIHEKV